MASSRRTKRIVSERTRGGGPAGRSGSIDLARLAAAVREILLAVGENPKRPGLLKTPARVARMYAEVFAGLDEDPAQHLDAVFREDYDEMVALRDIPFYSMCEHHLLPFTGKAHIAYVPDGRIIGVSKLARIVECFARRPQVQERLTSQIADLLMNGLKAKGVAVVIEASHACMIVRGVKKPGAEMVTSAVRGLFKANMDPQRGSELPPTRTLMQ
jgi:GTP cyclohydrolase I